MQVVTGTLLYKEAHDEAPITLTLCGTIPQVAAVVQRLAPPCGCCGTAWRGDNGVHVVADSATARVEIWLSQDLMEELGLAEKAIEVSELLFLWRD